MQRKSNSPYRVCGMYATASPSPLTVRSCGESMTTNGVAVSIVLPGSLIESKGVASLSRTGGDPDGALELVNEKAIHDLKRRGCQ